MDDAITRYADRLAALATVPRLRILRLLLAAHPNGMVPSGIQTELAIPASTLSHHLDRLKHEDLVTVRRDGTRLWYKANTGALREVVDFLYAECCTRASLVRLDSPTNKEIQPTS